MKFNTDLGNMRHRKMVMFVFIFCMCRCDIGFLFLIVFRVLSFLKHWQNLVWNQQSCRTWCNSENVFTLAYSTVTWMTSSSLLHCYHIVHNMSGLFGFLPNFHINTHESNGRCRSSPWCWNTLFLISCHNGQENMKQTSIIIPMTLNVATGIS